MRPPQRGCLRENTRDMTSVLCWCSTTASSDTSVGYIATPNTASPPVGYHHVAEHEPSARPEPVGDAGEQVRLTCSVEVVHVECRHDEVELPSAVGPGDGSPADRRRRPLRIVRGRSAFRPRPHNRSQHESPDGHGPSYRSIEPTAVQPTSATPRDGLHPSRAVACLPSDIIGPAC